MSKDTNTFELSKRHQLIDLNKNLVNFKLDFQVYSEENKEFEAVVLSQNKINEFENMESIEMKKAPGKISGTIIADNNKYENYFIILRSGEPQKVNVITTIEEIPPKEDFDLSNTTVETKEIEANECPFYKTKGCWILIALVVALFLFYFKDSIFKKKTKIVNMISVPETDGGVVENITVNKAPQTHQNIQQEI